ncbi:hypothetical protein MPH_14019 [Macrophomina phaseolina MS6]|uniref:Uncharacterized protein n=1 Tax=Macrophomina phaseolina (strain MS6) TaxID=1126212 RepID=K2RX72_MACPH|nr:hypothetical protein MPH_14019 [Macrophomina phaseolina MS6]
MMSNNRRSSAGGNVAVNMTICVSALANSPNSCNFGRKLPRPSNAVWHSSTTIRSNRCRLLNRSKNPPNALVAADSGVTKTTDASSGRRLSHSAAVMPARRHRSTMFSLHEFNGTTTTVVPCSPTAAAHNAGIMNATLLPAPVPITTNNGLRPSTTASTASSCTPLNSASLLPVNSRNTCRLSTVLTFFHRLKWAFITSASTAAADRFLPACCRNCRNADACCWNWWNLTLAALYRSITGFNSCAASTINRPYTAPAMRVVCPNCMSHV